MMLASAQQLVRVLGISYVARVRMSVTYAPPTDRYVLNAVEILKINSSISTFEEEKQ